MINEAQAGPANVLYTECRGWGWMDVKHHFNVSRVIGSLLSVALGARPSHLIASLKWLENISLRLGSWIFYSIALETV